MRMQEMEREKHSRCYFTTTLDTTSIVEHAYEGEEKKS